MHGNVAAEAVPALAGAAAEDEAILVLDVDMTIITDGVWASLVVVHGSDELEVGFVEVAIKVVSFSVV